MTPVYKSGDKADAGNYRPISLLSLASKLLERLVHNALMSHVLDHGLLADSQFGFRLGSSTLEALVSVSRDWFDSLEKWESVGCVFFDLSKAFDTLPHRLIF